MRALVRKRKRSVVQWLATALKHVIRTGNRYSNVLRILLILVGPTIVVLAISWSPLGHTLYDGLRHPPAPLVNGIPNLSLVLGLVLIVGMGMYLSIDYWQHRKPLKVAVPTVSYNLPHHVRVVTLPIVKSRWKFLLSSGGIGLASFALLGMTLVFGLQRFAEAKNMDITIAGSGTSGFVAFTPRPTLRGTAPPNSILTVNLDGQQVGTTNVTSTGQWTYQPSSNLSLGNHSVSLNAQEAGKYVYNVQSDKVVVINTSEHRISGKILLPSNVINSRGAPVLVTIPTKQRLYILTSDVGSSQATSYSTGHVITVDTSTGTIVETLSVPFRPEQIVASPDGGRIVVTGEVFNQIGSATGTRAVVINTTSTTLVGSVIEIPEIGYTSNSASISPFGVFSLDGSAYLIHTEHLLTTVNVSDGSSQTFDLTPYESQQSSVPNSDIVSTHTNDLIYMHIRGKIISVNIDSQQVVDQIDVTNNTIMSSINITSDDSALSYVSCSSSGSSNPGQMTTIDLVNKQELTPVTIRQSCFSAGYILTDPAGTRAYIADYGNNNYIDSIAVVNLTTRQLETPISLGVGESSAYNPLYQSPVNPNVGYYPELNGSDGSNGAIKELNLTTGQTTTIASTSRRILRFSSIGDPVIFFDQRLSSDSPILTQMYNVSTGQTTEIDIPLKEYIGSGVSTIATANQASIAEVSEDFRVETVTITDPVPNTKLTETSYTVHGRAPAGYKVEILVDGETKGVTTADQNNDYTFNLTGLASGTRVITAQTSADSYGFPIAYIGENTFAGYQFYNLDQNQVEIHDDVTFDGRMPEFITSDGNTALTFGYDSYTQDGLKLYKYDLISKQTVGSVTIDPAFLDNAKILSSANSTEIYFINIANTPNQYLVLNTVTLQTAIHNLDTNNPFDISVGNVFKKVGQTPDKSKIFLPTGSDSRIDIVHLSDQHISQLDTSLPTLAVDAPSNDFFIAYEGNFNGDPSNGDFIVSRYEVFDSHTNALLGSYDVTPRYFNTALAIYHPDQHSLYIVPTTGDAVTSDLTVINTSDWTVDRQITLADSISNHSSDSSVGITADGTQLLINSGEDNQLKRYSTTTGSLVGTKEFPGVIQDFGTFAGTADKFVATLSDNTTVLYNSTTNTIDTVITVGASGFAMTSNPLSGNGSGLLSFRGFVAGRTKVDVVVVLGDETNNPSTPPTDNPTTTTPTTPTNPSPNPPSTGPKKKPTVPAPATTTPQDSTPTKDNQDTVTPLNRQKVDTKIELPTEKVSVRKPLFSEPLARGISWLLLVILLIIAGLYGRRAQKEYVVRRHLERGLTHLKSMEQAADSYLKVTTHYLNTPVAIMNGAVELLTSLKKIPDWATQRLQAELKRYGASVAQISNDSQTSIVVKPEVTGMVVGSAVAKSNPLRQRAVWLPIVIVSGLFGLTSLLFVAKGIYSLRSTQFILQLLCLVLGAGLIVTAHKWRELQVMAQDTIQRAYAVERDLVKKRTDFMQRAYTVLNEHHENLSIITKDLHFIPETKSFYNGLNMLGQTVQSIGKVNQFASQTSDPPVIDLGQEVPRVLSALQSKAAEKKVQLQFDIPASLNLSIQHQEIAQLTHSLVDNALNFSKPDGRVTVTAQRAGKWINLAVSDTGSGIAPDRLSHLFEPFYRATNAETFDYEGLGLNLYVDKLIVEKLGGTMQVKSSKHGTVVSLSLPASSEQGLASPTLVAPVMAPA